MGKNLRLGVSLGIGILAAASASAQTAKSAGPAKSAVASGGTRVSAPLLTASADPRAFGIQDYTITVISAAQFQAFYPGGVELQAPLDFSTYSRICADCGEVGTHYFANLDIPAGAIIDYIGVNTATTVDAAMGFSLIFRDHLGGFAPLLSFSFPVHDGGGFATDMAGPLNILVPGNHDRTFLLDVEQAARPEFQYFGFVEVWWRRAVSDAPATASFGDVPTSHPFFQFIEALAASGITAGCGDGTDFCPDNPLTRGQMAVFLSKALGLHWPN